LCYVGQPVDAPDGVHCNYKGKSNQYVPKWNGNVGLTWQQDVFDDHLLTLSADTRFSGSYFTQGDLNPLQRQKTFAMVDARIAFGSSSKSWEVGFSVRNLTNHYVVGFASNTPLAANVFGAPSYLHVPLQPRSFVLQVRTKF
jgi:iron complex outermembrane recepter protein